MIRNSVTVYLLNAYVVILVSADVLLLGHMIPTKLDEHAMIILGQFILLHTFNIFLLARLKKYDKIVTNFPSDMNYSSDSFTMIYCNQHNLLSNEDQ